MNFGEALTALKNGDKVYRVGWMHKGMWIVLEDTTRFPNTQMQPFINLKVADDLLVPWTPSQTDVLAEDWLLRIERAGGTSEPRTPEPTPVTPSATTAAQDAGITLTVHVAGSALYDAILPHIQDARRIARLRNGHYPLD